MRAISSIFTPARYIMRPKVRCRQDVVDEIEADLLPGSGQHLVQRGLLVRVQLSRSLVNEHGNAKHMRQES